MSSTVERPIVWAILDCPPNPNWPNGFSPRFHQFLKAVGSRSQLNVIALRRQDAEWNSEDFLAADLPITSFRCENLPANPFVQPGMQGDLRRLGHHVFGRSPSLAHPRRMPTLSRQRRQDRLPDLVITFLPQTAHACFEMPRSVACICVLEEGQERLQQSSIEHHSRSWRKTLSSRVYRAEQTRMDRFYQRLAKRAAFVVAISEDEKSYFARNIPPEQIKVFPHAVDCTTFSPFEEQECSVAQDVDVAVFGNLAAGRNYEGALQFFHALSGRTQEAVLQKPPSEEQALKWAFVGLSPHESLQALSSDQVLVTGYVSDVRPFYARTKVVAVPALYGTGVKTTVLQAWAMGRPVVATPFALKGVPARDGENVLIGESVQELAQHTRSLLSSSHLRHKLTLAGLTTVRRERNISVISEQFADLCQTVWQGQAAPKPT